MGTKLSEINDLFMMKVTDYRLTDLFTTSEEDFETFLEAWLIMGIAEFDKSSKISLEYDSASKEFVEELPPDVKVILATLMMKMWLQKDVNDITQFRLHITDRDFKMASEAMNLREKKDYLVIVTEQCSQLISDYEYKNNDWESWRNQQFF